MSLYLIFLLLSSSKYLAVTEVKPIDVVRQAKATTTLNKIPPDEPSKPFVIAISNAV